MVNFIFWAEGLEGLELLTSEALSDNAESEMISIKKKI